MKLLAVLVSVCLIESVLTSRIRIRFDQALHGDDEHDGHFEEHQERQERRLDYIRVEQDLVKGDQVDEYLFVEAPLDHEGLHHDHGDDQDDDDDDDKDPPAHNNVSGNRGLVPQLWPNYTGPELPAAESVPCEVAQLQCAYRSGCGLALQNYLLGCSDLVKGTVNTCNTHCKHSLIALLSTPEGQRLMKCNCTGNTFCEESKTRIEPCKKEVVQATEPDSQVSCSAAQWICAADAMCSTAMDYYYRFCSSMFRGKKCTKRCINSISILRRQAAAGKLENCVCDGTEDFDCRSIKDNMDRLCFAPPDQGDSDNEIDVDGHHPKSPVRSGSIRATLHKALLFFAFIVSLIGALLSALTQSSDQT